MNIPLIDSALFFFPHPGWLRAPFVDTLLKEYTADERSDIVRIMVLTLLCIRTSILRYYKLKLILQ